LSGRSPTRPRGRRFGSSNGLWNGPLNRKSTLACGGASESSRSRSRLHRGAAGRRSWRPLTSARRSAAAGSPGRVRWMDAQGYAPICRWRASVRDRAGSLVGCLRDHALAVDAVLGLALGVATVAPVISKLQGALPWAMTVLAGIVVAATVATRRRWPLAAVLGASLTLPICAALHGRATDNDASLVALLLLV
jgi:hypothetical protein